MGRPGVQPPCCESASGSAGHSGTPRRRSPGRPRRAHGTSRHRSVYGAGRSGLCVRTGRSHRRHERGAPIGSMEWTLAHRSRSTRSRPMRRCRRAGRGNGTKACSTWERPCARSAGHAATAVRSTRAVRGSRAGWSSQTPRSARPGCPVVNRGSTARIGKVAAGWSMRCGGRRWCRESHVARAAGWPDDEERALRAADTLVVDGLARWTPAGALALPD